MSKRTIADIVAAYPEIWKTEAAFMSWVRGGLQRGLWVRHPVKLEYIKTRRFKGPLGRQTKSNPEGLVWCGTCENCGGMFRESQMQVDHIAGEAALREEGDIGTFAAQRILVLFEDLQWVCTECHAIKTYAERYHMTFEEAAKHKKAIEFSHKSIAEQKSILAQLGVRLAQDNQNTRRQAYLQHLQKAGSHGK